MRTKTSPAHILRHGLATAALPAAACIALALGGCGGGGDDSPATADRTVSSLKLIGQQVLPRRSQFQGTVIGGLSGIDYLPASNSYVLISDDRTTTDSANPPRFYTASLTFDATSFSAVTFLSTQTMKQADGSVFPKVPDPKVADPESIRLDPVSLNYVWSSEGDRTLTSTPPRIIDPFVREMRADGTVVRDYALPSMFKMSSGNTGPNGNLVFEGLAFTPDRSKLFVSMEGPLLQDAALPTVTAGSVSRLTAFDRASGAAVAQYVYPIDKIQVSPVPADQFSVNGPTEILALSDKRFLVLERSFSVGVIGNQVRLYEIDISNATNVLATASLNGAAYTAVTKRLVLDFETLKGQLGGIANLEGLTFGPKLANGHDSLVVVADDNLPTADSLTDRNQILVFDVQP